jgi:hypothetical protein
MLRIKLIHYCLMAISLGGNGLLGHDSEGIGWEGNKCPGIDGTTRVPGLPSQADGETPESRCDDPADVDVAHGTATHSEPAAQDLNCPSLPWASARDLVQQVAEAQGGLEPIPKAGGSRVRPQGYCDAGPSAWLR